jgi:hypothetical protein
VVGHCNKNQDLVAETMGQRIQPLLRAVMHSHAFRTEPEHCIALHCIETAHNGQLACAVECLVFFFGEDKYHQCRRLRSTLQAIRRIALACGCSLSRSCSFGGYAYNTVYNMQPASHIDLCGLRPCLCSASPEGTKFGIRPPARPHVQPL